MRTAAEGIRLCADAAGLWWPRLPQLISVYAFGFALHLLGLRLSVLLGPGQPVLGTLVFVLAVLAQVGALVLMLWLCRPADDHERALDVAALAIGPFLAVYALWGLVDDEVYALFTANIAVRGFGGPDDWSVNLRWWQLYLSLAVAAWLLRQLVARVARRHPRRPLLLLGVVLEGLWTFASALTLLAVLGRVVGWITSRAGWQAVVGGWYALLAALPELRLPFELTLPEALHQVVGWLIDTVLPGFWSAVLLPLMWLALTVLVYTRRDLDAGPAAATVARTTGRWVVPARLPTRWRALLHRAGLLLTGDLRTKYLPVLDAVRLLWAAGPRFLAAYLVLATAVATARTWAVLGLARLLGPRDPYVALAWSWAEDLLVGCVFTTFAIAVYATAGRRVLVAPVSGDGAPAGAGPVLRTTAPGP